MQINAMDRWAPGYTQSELDAAQERYGLNFPPDLIALFLEKQPREGYRWNIEDHRIREMLEWPLEALLFDVDHGLWWPGWGKRPEDISLRHGIVREALAQAPRLIPILSHRFLPETPSEAGNPVFSMHGFDTVYYGANLSQYFVNEFGGTYNVGPVRYIPFWSDIAEGHDQTFTGAPYVGS